MLRTPHPFHVFLNNSHPPLDARLKAIRDYHGKCYNESMWVAQPAKEKWLSVAVTPRFVNRAPCSCLREVGSRLGWFILRCVVFMGKETCVRFACTKYDECLEVYGILIYILVCTCILPEVQRIFTGVLLSGATTQHTCRTWVQRPTRLHASTVYSLCEGHQVHQSLGADKDQTSCHFIVSFNIFQLPNHALTLLSSQLIAGHGSPTTCRGGSSPTCFSPGTDVEKGKWMQTSQTFRQEKSGWLAFGWSWWCQIWLNILKFSQNIMAHVTECVDILAFCIIRAPPNIISIIPLPMLHGRFGTKQLSCLWVPHVPHHFCSEGWNGFGLWGGVEINQDLVIKCLMNNRNNSKTSIPGTVSSYLYITL